jgi:uncharacterized membrane protein
MKAIEAIMFLIIALAFIFLAIYFWYIALIFVVVGLFSLLNENLQSKVYLKALFVAMYFVLIFTATSIFRHFGIEPIPQITNSDTCANGYVCY